ncbi:MAG: T9SS type A sorting domain-containing protein [Bacteroidota bacterium]
MKMAPLFLVFIIYTPAIAQWNNPTIIDATGNVGWYVSMAIVSGNPAICYYDVSNGDLKYARATDSAGSFWGAPITIDATGDVGQFNSMIIVNGNPAISYHDNGNGDLKYIRATDATGSSWGTPLTLESGTNLGLNTSLKIIGGVPAISYRDATNGDLKYIRANNVDGSSWGLPLIVDNGSNTGWYSSLEIVSGNPAIAYWNNLNDNLIYVRANDATGSSWGTPITVDSPGNVGAWSFLIIVNGNPAIGYYDATNDHLKFIRATNANGSNWGTSIELTETVDIGGNNISMVIVDGNPAICYHDWIADDLKYIRANDVDGSNWGSPITVDNSANNHGIYSSMTIVAGNPAIAYLDDTDNDVKYIRSENMTGLSVELISFAGVKLDKGIELLWQTASEVNNEGFDVERSADGENWESIDFIYGQITTAESYNYTYFDEQPLSGKNYYRLKIIDLDGSFEYSKIIEINFQKGDSDIVIVPNPVRNGEVIISLPQINVEDIEVHLFDVSGKLVSKILVSQFDGKVLLDLDNLRDGTYFVRVKNGQKYFAEKLLIKAK